MDVASMCTEDLERQLHELLSAEPTDLIADQVRKILKELRRRENAPGPTSPIWDEDRQCWI